MDLPVQPPIQVTTTKPNFNFRAILWPMLTLFIGLAVGFGINRLLTTPTKLPPTQPVQSPQVSTLVKDELPVGLSLLKNPIVYEWRGSVKGKLTQKDTHTFTLVDDQGHSITVTDIMPSGDQFKTIFVDMSLPKDKQKTSLETIPLGSTLLGDFFIFKGGPNTPVGSMFIKQ